ncbi:MAG TPA: molybdopterin-dependent oxidoreductase [Candidatus Udaeobacter sp.]|nr:molybdopterin-dependent oxidoreductase [Candidatus Udaeobacter sp.]
MKRRKAAAFSGFGWGCIGGIVLVALMYLAKLVFALRPLPQLLNEPLLAIMPGWLFGFLIDNLQHAGKVLEELGLIIAMVAALGLLGAAAYVGSLRWTSQYLPFAFAAIGWAVVCGVLLPVAGAGPLGLNDGPTTPLIWAALFAIYAVILQMGAQPAPEVDGGRRRFISAVPLTIGAVGLGVLAWRLLPDWYTAVSTASESSLRSASPAITPVSDFYVVSKNLGDPVVDGQSWRLHVQGLVEKPVTLSLSDLRALPPTNEYATFACISNDVGGNLISTGAFTGVPLRDLVNLASPQSQAAWVAFRSRDGYTESLPLSEVQAKPEIIVAYDLNGSPLPDQHGYPARMVIPGRYGMKAPKWLDSIELVTHETGGFWEQQGWDHNAFVQTTSRFDVPHDADILKLGTISVAGIAFAGERGVSKVEYSTDGGTTWNVADADAPLSPLTWVLWRATWTPTSEGAYTLMVRATDRTGRLQESRASGSYPSGATGLHTIHVNISK